MNIICDIVDKVKEELVKDKNDVTQAMLVAPYYLNQEIKDEELQEIIHFSKKLDQRDCPNFKSIYDQEINNAVWSVVCCAIQSNDLIEEINKLLAIYTDLNIHLDIVFTIKKQWKMEMENYGNGEINYQILTSYSRQDLFFEIIKVLESSIIC